MPTPLREPSRRSPVLVLVHGTDCPMCRTYLHDLAGHQDSIREWDGRLLAVTPEVPGVDERHTPAGELPFPVLSDPGHRLAATLAIQPPAVIVADQWGAIHEVTEAGSEHQFSSTADLVDWVRYLAVQCPECEGEAV